MVDFFFSSRRRHTRWPRDWSSDVCSSDLGEGDVRQGAVEVGVVGRQVEQTMAAEVEEDGRRLAAFPGFDRLVNDRPDRVRRLRRRNGALGASELHGGVEDGALRVGNRLDEPMIREPRYQWRHPMITKA